MPDIMMLAPPMDKNNNNTDIASKLEKLNFGDDPKEAMQMESNQSEKNEMQNTTPTESENKTRPENSETPSENQEKENEAAENNQEKSEPAIETPQEANRLTMDHKFLDCQKHPLYSSWTLWHLNGDQKAAEKKAMAEAGNNNWSKNMIELYTFKTVEDFWSLINRIQLPAKMRVKNDYMLFREGINPCWEDTHNRKGGSWKLVLPSRMRNEFLDGLWIDTLLSMIGEQYGDLGDMVNGAFLQRRQKEDRIQVWTSKADDREANETIGKVLKSKLHLSNDSHIHYLKHDDEFGGNANRTHQSWSRKHKTDALYTV